MADWLAYGRDPCGTHYSPLAQITRANVTQLQVAWTYRTGEGREKAVSSDQASFEATPLLVDGTLYLSTPFNRVIALDPETGAEGWTYNPRVDVFIAYAVVTSRGVSSWLDRDRPAGAPCRWRIFVATIDAPLIALNAATGTPCQDFGCDGQADLTHEVRLIQRGIYQVTSPPAVVVGTKMGHIFVLHRETGEPLFPVEERPVPASTVPGEEAWPTQPFPTLPPPLVPQKLTAEDAWGMTSEDREWCRERIKALRSEGIFTPPSQEGTIVFPGLGGGINWGSLSYEPMRGLVVANTTRFAHVVKLLPRRDSFKFLEGVRLIGRSAPQHGTPYAVYWEALLDPGGAPCNLAPWGTLAAVDLASGAVRWEVPLGGAARSHAPTVPPSAGVRMGITQCRGLPGHRGRPGLHRSCAG